ncbi:MAG: AraC family transcriptional regulator [Lachnospiraceae bacterium]|nr:AraC family transcriptional regulator [Lachnospiraceae bacterium]
MEENLEVFQRETEDLKISENHIVKKQDMKNRHFHDSIELFILTKGTRYFFVDRQIYVIGKGTAILIPPGQIHKTSTYGEDARHNRFLLQFSKEGVLGMLQSAYGMDFEDFLQRYNGPAVFRPEKWKQVLQGIRQIKEAFETENVHLPMVRMLAYSLLSLYTEEMDHQRSLQREKDERLTFTSDVHNSIQQVIEYLNEHYMEELTLDKLAKQFFISRAFLTRNFRQVTGVTVVQYLTVVRIRRACLLLKDTEESITAIAEQCGFTNTTYFENVFRRLRGMTPGQYRKMVRTRT